jgi:hypothetical protein
MIGWPILLPVWVPPNLLAGIAVNLEIAALALVAGLMLGMPLALSVRSRGVLKGAASVVIGGLRAAPTFVVMFFLLNVLPREFELAGWHASLSPVEIVALSLIPYSASYVADNGAEALLQWHSGDRLAALLLLPNLTRAYFVLVMSSGAGAAIGVAEGITIILRQAESLHSVSDQALLFALGIICFAIPLQAGFFAVGLLRRWLTRFAETHTASSSPSRV